MINWSHSGCCWASIRATQNQLAFWITQVQKYFTELGSWSQDHLMQSGYLLKRLMAQNKRLYSGVIRSEWRQRSHCSSLSDSCMVNISRPRSESNDLRSVSVIYCILIPTLTALLNGKKSSLLRVLRWKVWANSDNSKWQYCCAVSDWKLKWKRRLHGYLNVCGHDTW